MDGGASLRRRLPRMARVCRLGLGLSLWVVSVRVIRVFPRRTKATPTDDMARVGCSPGLFDEADEVHVSVTFTWDIPAAEKLARQWETVAPVKMGGPAMGTRGEEFTPGQFIREGYTITSRGCPNSCWFCSVPKREGRTVRELPIRDGLNVLDDNLLAASRSHIEAVFSMLKRVKESTPGSGIEFTGGLEAARLEWWHAQALRELRPRQMFFAYDTPDDLPPLRRAAEMMREAGHPFAGHRVRAYVLVGYKGDTPAAAETRIAETMALGIMPMAMPYRAKDGRVTDEWRSWARQRMRPAIMASGGSGRHHAP